MKNRFLFLGLIAMVTTIVSCQKEYSDENGSGSGAGVIIGSDCRINKIAYNDSATGAPIGSLIATINSSDAVTDITKFDSITLSIDFNSVPQYFSDTVYIDPDQYYIFDATTRRINSFHGLIDPTVPGSPEYDIAFVYDAANFLINKVYTYTLSPGTPFQQVTYTYTGGNLTHMEDVDMFTFDKIKDADLTYYTNIAPKNFMYLFPDEDTHAEMNQFFNFGRKTTNACKDYKVRYYDPGNTLVDSTVSTFKTYILSRDNYVTSVYMLGDDQTSIPSPQAKLTFGYQCK
ncbi:MAG: hypothetical protein JST86_07000 [Bacteroidetes bacterium]|nr:hypothetical protein [Bacteroidota bacterium]